MKNTHTDFQTGRATMAPWFYFCCSSSPYVFHPCVCFCVCFCFLFSWFVCLGVPSQNCFDSWFKELSGDLLVQMETAKETADSLGTFSFNTDLVPKTNLQI
eukprot:c19753_g2_i3.p1 GENE.c19753_g2_i3~~c19753_g2_i3.p1  ORF type:complete len:101 (+),score=22.67 c19753_g2_i3:85-387(+)